LQSKDIYYILLLEPFWIWDLRLNHLHHTLIQKAFPAFERRSPPLRAGLPGSQPITRGFAIFAQWRLKPLWKQPGNGTQARGTRHENIDIWL
jgi:hypothetical protein